MNGTQASFANRIQSGYSLFMTDYTASPFHRFQGWRFLALFIVFAIYTAWYIGPGPFGQLAALEGYSTLQESGYYTGAEAVRRIGTLDTAGLKLKYIALALDVPYMILQALVFEAGIAFGIRHLRLKNPKWNLLFILPIAFLLADFGEDSFLALTMATGSEIFGSLASVFTMLKFATFIPGILAALIMLIGGIIGWIKHR